MFNIGDYRRKLGYGGVDKSFFERGNEEGQRIRSQMVQVRRVWELGLVNGHHRQICVSIVLRYLTVS